MAGSKFPAGEINRGITPKKQLTFKYISHNIKKSKPPKGNKMSKIAALSITFLLWALPLQAQNPQYYLFYNIDSPDLDEISVSRQEMAEIFDSEFGPASDELPDKVKEKDFFAALFPDKSYVFILNSTFNCGRLGCNTQVYVRDKDGDLMYKDSSFPVLCEENDTDKLLCVKGGYKKVKKEIRKKGPVHYPAPVPEGSGVVKDVSGH